MDELQFNESLDALLANEAEADAALVDATGNNNSISIGSIHPSYHQQNNDNSNNNNMMTMMMMMNSSSYTFPSPEGLQQQQQQQQQQGMYPSYATATFNQNNDVGYGQQQQQQQQQQQHLEQFPTSSVAAAATAAGTFVAPHSHFSGAASVSSRGSFNSHGSSNYAPSGTSNKKAAAATGRASRRRGSNASSTTSSTTERLSGSKRSRGGDGGDRSTTAVSEDEDDKDKRRQDRNLREQQRSHQITAQIDVLREVLASSNVASKPDKYSTLVSVVDYIKQLQERSSMLDGEHKKLIDTITRTDDIVKGSHLPPSACADSGGGGGGGGSSGVDSSSLSASGSSSDVYNEDELLFVRNVDYKSIFFRCGMPLAVASVDGRFLDCNVEFETVTGYKREELLPSVEPSVVVTTGDASEVSSSLSVGSSMDELGNLLTVDDSNSNRNESTQQPQGKTGSRTDTASPDGIASSTIRTKKSNTSQSRNLSLFNILSRDCMEHVFLALSKVLKHPDDKDKESEMEPPADYWTGIVRLNRNPDNEVCSLCFHTMHFIPHSDQRQWYCLTFCN
jgi:PAS domain-containing protein